jgi:class 3 adenylate cyclase
MSLQSTLSRFVAVPDLKMRETPLSGAVQLAWQLAGDFALRSGESVIHPIHLLYGLCSVEKVPDLGARAASQDSLITERESLAELARRHSLELATVRRAIRDSVSTADRPTPGAEKQVVNRSPAVRRIFRRAAEIADGNDNVEVDLLALLQALLEAQDQKITALTAASSSAFAAILQELQNAAAPQTASIASAISQLTDLDSDPDSAHRSLQIADSIDANHVIKGMPASIAGLAWLSEFAWEFGTKGELDALLQKASEELLCILPNVEHNVILVRDASDNELLLKAFSPSSWSPRVSMTSVRRAMQEQKGFVWLRGEDLTASQKELDVETGIYAPLVVNGQALGAICLDTTVTGQHLGCEELELVTCFAHQVALAIANYELRTSLKQNADVMERLLTNFSPKVRTRLLQRARMGRLVLGGELSVVSILCSDIRGFTRLTADMSADDIVAMLNEYFTALVDCIFRHDGTVDKFVGDSILAVFGSPEADPKHHQKAVSAAIEMQQIMQRVSDKRAARGDVVCVLGIGIHAGEALHGFIGSPERMEYTVIGETVNLAARYSDGAKGTEVLISPEVYQRVWSMFQAEKIFIPTKHEGDLPAYRLLGQNKSSAQSTTASDS